MFVVMIILLPCGLSLFVSAIASLSACISLASCCWHGSFSEFPSLWTVYWVAGMISSYSLGVYNISEGVAKLALGVVRPRGGVRFIWVDFRGGWDGDKQRRKRP